MAWSEVDPARAFALAEAAVERIPYDYHLHRVRTQAAIHAALRLKDRIRTASYIPSSGYTTHTYSWTSTYPGGYPQVLVTTGNKPASCLVPLGGVNQLLLTESTSGVSITSEFVEGEWLHTVTWIAYCADSCTYTYYVRNVVGGQVYSSSPKTLNVSVCADITE